MDKMLLPKVSRIGVLEFDPVIFPCSAWVKSCGGAIGALICGIEYSGMELLILGVLGRE